MGLTTLCYLEKDNAYLMLHRIKKDHDINKGKWIGVGGKCATNESPEACLIREVKEETNLDLKGFHYRGIISFIYNDNPTEYMHLFTADNFEGSLGTCDEGELTWVKKSELGTLNLWEGDLIFLKLLLEDAPCFTLTLRYHDDHLETAILNGEPISLSNSLSFF